MASAPLVPTVATRAAAATACPRRAHNPGLAVAGMSSSMSERLSRRLELAANLCILIAAPLLCVAVARNYLGPPKGPVPKTPVGTRVSLPNVDWAAADETLVLALQSGCRFCSESGPFYSQLANESTQYRRVHLLAVLPSPQEEARDYVKSIGLESVDVRQAPLRSINVSDTPTLFLVDYRGIATRAWIGKLSPPREAEVLRWVRCGNLKPCE